MAVTEKKTVGNGNLKPWKKGQSGNLKGRPLKGYSITEMMKRMLEEKPELRAAIGDKIAEKALKGDLVAMKLLWNYMDGMPTQGLEHSGKDGGPVEFHTKVTTINEGDPQLQPEGTSSNSEQEA